MCIRDSHTPSPAIRRQHPALYPHQELVPSRERKDQAWRRNARLSILPTLLSLRTLFREPHTQLFNTQTSSHHVPRGGRRGSLLQGYAKRISSAVRHLHRLRKFSDTVRGQELRQRARSIRLLLFKSVDIRRGNFRAVRLIWYRWRSGKKSITKTPRFVQIARTTSIKIHESRSDITATQRVFFSVQFVANVICSWNTKRESVPERTKATSFSSP